MIDKQVIQESRCHPGYKYKYPEEWEAATLELLNIFDMLRERPLLTSVGTKIDFIEDLIRDRINPDYPKNCAALLHILSVFKRVYYEYNHDRFAAESTEKALDFIYRVIRSAHYDSIRKLNHIDVNC
jgi:hypothetical protein